MIKLFKDYRLEISLWIFQER